jgi:hypothetical protein
MAMKKVAESNTRKADIKSKGIIIKRKKKNSPFIGVARNGKFTVSESPHFQSTKTANRHKACVDNSMFLHLLHLQILLSFTFAFTSLLFSFYFHYCKINVYTADVFKTAKKDIANGTKKGYVLLIVSLHIIPNVFH